MGLCELPADLIKIIIQHCECPQWFVLSKQLSVLASKVISPLEYRKSASSPSCNYETSSFIWAIENNKKVVVASLLKDSRIDPTSYNHHAISIACAKGYKDIVELLLQHKRADPSVNENYAIRYASYCGFTEIIKLLLQGTIMIL
jgi:hypothetical protein